MNIHAEAIFRCLVAAILLAVFSPALVAGPQTTFFNYQGQLQENGAPANGSYDLAFELYDDATTGNQVGGTLTSAGHSVSNGLFSIGLNFGSTVFNGTQLWLQVYVNTIAMTPRTAIRLAPVSEYSLTAASVDDGSVTRAKLAGASTTFTGGLSLPAGSCGNGIFGVSGAKIGDAVVFSWAAAYTPPKGIVYGPASVTAADTVKVQLCNVSNTDFSDATVPVTVQTFR